MKEEVRMWGGVGGVLGVIGGGAGIWRAVFLMGKLDLGRVRFWGVGWIRGEGKEGDL